MAGVSRRAAGTGGKCLDEFSSASNTLSLPLTVYSL